MCDLSRKRKVAFYPLLVLSIMSTFCSYIRPVNYDAHDAISEFIRTVEDDQTETFYTLLAQDVQSRINYEQLSRASGDFQGIVEAFRQAGITTRSKDEIPFFVSKLGGQKGALLFVVIEENEEWRIANIFYHDEP